MLKKFISICLCSAISLFSVTAFAEIDASNIDGYLTLSGQGVIGNYSNSSPSPFTEDFKNINYAVITSGITNISNNVLKNCFDLRDVIIPSSVKEIGWQAFAGCMSLSRVIIPYGVTHIKNYAFIDCKSLKEVYIPDTVQVIGESAFYGCDNLTVYANSSIAAKTYCQTDNVKLVYTDKVNNIIDAYRDIKIFINGTELKYSNPVIMKNYSTLIPLRVIFEAVGCEVGWDDSTKTALITKGNTVLTIPTETSTIYINGHPQTLATDTTLMCDSTMIHIRAVEHLGMNVDWNQDTKTISITY